MNTKLVNTAADVILRALTQNRTAAGIAVALESAQLLQSPETAAEREKLRTQFADAAATVAELVQKRGERMKVENALREEVEELRARLAKFERPVDEDPIRYTLTEQAEEGCDHPNGYGPNGCTGCGAFRPADGEDDVTPQVNKLRALLAGQREQAEAARAVHTKHADSEHCQHDGEQWPCPTVAALGETGGA